MERVVFQRNVESAHLIMEAPEEDGLQYQFPMLLYNHPEGFLPVSECFAGEIRRLYYNVTGGCSLEAMMARGHFDDELIRLLMTDLVTALESAGAYMLDGGRISLSPPYIYFQDDHFRFCYIPFQEPDFEHGFADLTAFIAEHVDDQDEEALQTAGMWYKIGLEREADIEIIRNTLNGTSSGQEIASPIEETQDLDLAVSDEDEYGFVFEEQEMLREDTEEFPLWSELIEEPEKKRIKLKKSRHRKSRESSWGDWSAFKAENG